MPNITVLGGLTVPFRFISTGYLDLVENVSALVVLAVIGEVNVKFNFGFRRPIFIGGFLGLTTIDFDFIDGRLQFEDGVRTIFPSKRGLEMLIWPQSGRQCDGLNCRG